MLTQLQLIQQITNTLGKEKVLELSRILKKQNFTLRDLIDITFNSDKNIAFRASWILENIYLQNPETYLNELEYLIQKFNDVTYPSCQRHYAKIMMHITSPKAPYAIKSQLLDINFKPVIEKLFGWMIDPQIKIAVKVFSSETLFNLRDRYDWISEELRNQIQYLMVNGTAAIQSHGKAILKKLS